jgi:hypothetical protein
MERPLIMANRTCNAALLRSWRPTLEADEEAADPYLHPN